MNQPRNGAKDAPESGFLRPVPGLTRPARGSQCWRTGLCSCLLRTWVAEESSRPAKKTRHSNRKRQSRNQCEMQESADRNVEVVGVQPGCQPAPQTGNFREEAAFSPRGAVTPAGDAPSTSGTNCAR